MVGDRESQDANDYHKEGAVSEVALMQVPELIRTEGTCINLGSGNGRIFIFAARNGETCTCLPTDVSHSELPVLVKWCSSIFHPCAYLHIIFVLHIFFRREKFATYGLI